MIEGWVLWLLLVGLAIGATVTAVALVRLPRQTDDIGMAERRAEAAWVSETIERHGGIAPPSLVEEVLELHEAYLQTPRVPVLQDGGPPPVPPPPVSPPPVPPPPASPPPASPTLTAPPPPGAGGQSLVPPSPPGAGGQSLVPPPPSDYPTAPPPPGA